jgi:hypothetical protein
MSTCWLPDFTPPPLVAEAEVRHRRHGVGQVRIYLATRGEFLVAAVTRKHCGSEHKERPA